MIPDKYVLEITDDMPELEKFVRQQAMAYLDTTVFLSAISPNHPNINSVYEKGKEIIPYLIKLFKEKDAYSNQNLYTHYFLLVMERFYGNPFNGYIGIPLAVRYWLKRYEYGLLDGYDDQENAEKKKSFLSDFVIDTVKEFNELQENKEE